MVIIMGLAVAYLNASINRKIQKLEPVIETDRSIQTY